MQLAILQGALPPVTRRCQCCNTSKGNFCDCSFYSLSPTVFFFLFFSPPFPHMYSPCLCLLPVLPSATFSKILSVHLTFLDFLFILFLFYSPHLSLFPTLYFILPDNSSFFTFSLSPSFHIFLCFCYLLTAAPATSLYFHLPVLPSPLPSFSTFLT